MTIRTISETVTFRRPFKLRGADDVQPAGRYVVETDEEPLQLSSLPAYRRLSTYMRLPGRSGTMELARIIDIDPAELSAALAVDAEAPETAALPAHPMPVVVKGRKHATLAFVKDGWRRWLALNATELTWTALLTASWLLMEVLTRSIDTTSGPP